LFSKEISQICAIIVGGVTSKGLSESGNFFVMDQEISATVPRQIYGIGGWSRT